MIGFMGASAMFLIVMGVLRPREGLMSAANTESLIRKLDVKLKRAGIVSVSASAVLFGGMCVMAVVGMVSLFAFRSVPLSFILTVVVPAFINLDLDRRARQYQDKLHARLVPFLRKITSQVRTGQNPTKAFAVAANEDKLLSWVLREQLADLSLQAPFHEVLRSTVKVMPLRPWVQFVRSMESFAQSGGELAEILDNSVDRIQSQHNLRQTLMGDVATYRGQQMIILGFAVAIPAALYVMGKELFGTLLTTPAGILACLVAAGMDAFAVWMTNRAIRDVESKLEA